MTLICMCAMQVLKVRNDPEHYLSFACPWAGFLHYDFTSADVVRRCQMGAKLGTYPASITKFAKPLQHTHVLGLKPNYNATYKLIVHMVETDMLNEMMEIASVCSLDGLKCQVEQGNWIKLIDDTYDKYYMLLKVQKLHMNAGMAATVVFQKVTKPVIAKKKEHKGPGELSFLQNKVK